MKKHLLFALLALMFAPWATRAQNELTVADGTTTNQYVPIYGYYADEEQHNQVIYPANMLDEMAGGTISSLTFYMSQPTIQSWGITVTLSFAEIDETSLSELITTAELSQVWQGAVTGMDSVWTIELDEPYTYNGGNLLIDIQTTSNKYSAGYFLGSTADSTSFYSYAYSSNAQNFMPKVTFSYTLSGAYVCYTPKNLVVSDETNNGATISWTPNGDETQWTVLLNGQDYATVSSTIFTFSGLNANTTYSVSVRANCPDGSTSNLLNGNFKTLCQEGNCNLTFQANGSGSYAGALNVWQNGEHIYNITGSWNNNSGSTEVCSGEPLQITYTAPNYTYGTGGWNVIDASGATIASVSSTDSTGTIVLSTDNPCPSCYAVKDIVSTEVSASTLTIAWTPQGSATEWAIYLDDEYIATSFDTMYTFDGLESNTLYTVGVRSICGTIDTSFAISASFRTDLGGQHIIVANGTSTNQYIPIYGNYVDAAQHNQILYPAQLTESMAGNNITGMVFYMAQTSTIDWNTTVTIRLSEIADTGLNNSLINEADFVEVWQGTVTGQDELLQIDFTNAFAYNGSDLLVDIQTTAGSYRSSSFYGIVSTAASRYSYNTTDVSQGFIPKTAFFYNDAPFCNAPSGLTVSDISTNSATISWTPGGDETSYGIMLDGQEISDYYTDTIYTFTDLDANTGHSVAVYAICSSGRSISISKSFRTACAGDTCDMTFSPSSSSASYTGSINLWQNGSLLQSFAPSYGYRSLTTSICDVDSLIVTYVAPTYSSSSTYTWDFEDAAGSVVKTFECKDYTTGDTVYYYIDEACPNCWPVSNLAVDNNSITQNTASLTWEGGAESYTIELKASGAVYTTETSDTPSIDLTNLESNTEYTAIVKAICENGISHGRSVDFTTLPDCVSPQVHVAEIGTDFITVSLTPRGNETEWEIGILSTTDTFRTSFTGDTSFTFTGLDELTNYVIEAKAICSEGDTSATTTLPTRTIANGDMCDLTISITPTAYISKSQTLTFSQNGTEVASVYPISDNPYDTVISVYSNMQVDLSWYYLSNYSFVIRNANGDTLAKGENREMNVSTISSPCEAPTYYTISATANNTAMGTVTGGGRYIEGETVTLTATPAVGYLFDSWSDGVYNNTRTLTASEDVELTAIFIVNEAFDTSGTKCQLTIYMHDGYGDGWNGNTLVINQGNTDIAEITLQDGESGEVSVSVYSSMSVNLSWVNGSFANETSFELLNANGDTLAYGNGGLSTTYIEEPCGEIICNAADPTNLTVTFDDNMGTYISWDANGASQWTLTLYGAEILTYNLTYPTSGFSWLTPNTGYTVMVQATCPDGWVSNTAELFFTTPDIADTNDSDFYTITLNVNDPSMGSIACNSTTFAYGEQAFFCAVPNVGYQFIGWNDGNLDNPRTIEVTSNATYTAQFAAANADCGNTTVFDTVIVNYTIYDTVFENHYQYDTTIVNVYDTVIANLYQYDTTIVNVYDTVIANLYQYDTTINNYYGNDTVVLVYRDTVTISNYYYDTVVVNNTLHDTIIYTTTYHDTVYSSNYYYDTVHLNHYYYDTAYVHDYIHDTVILTRYLYDTASMDDDILDYIGEYIDSVLHDTNYVNSQMLDELRAYIDAYLPDTVTITDTFTVYQTMMIHDTIYIHDTVFVNQEGIDDVSEASIRIFQRDGNIVVESLDYYMLPEVRLYDAVGREISLQYNTSELSRVVLPVPASGVYLVRIGDMPARRVVVVK